MARIRSVHPGQWTDEDFVSCSMPARLLALALRNVADDRGVFEWKLLTLKMQLFPADAVDVGPLLEELSSSGQVRKFTVGDKHYGAIRNFRKWQRPEKPKPVHPIPEELLPFVGLSATDPQPASDDEVSGRRRNAERSATDNGRAADQSATSRRPVGDQSGKVSAEEGGRREEEEASSLRSDGAPAAPPPPPVDRRAELWSFGPAALHRMTGKPDGPCRSITGRLLRDAQDDCELVLRKLREAEEARVADPVAWLEAAVRSATGQRVTPLRPGQGSGLGQVIRGMRAAQQHQAPPPQRDAGPMFDGMAEEVA